MIRIKVKGQDQIGPHTIYKSICRDYIVLKLFTFDLDANLMAAIHMDALPLY